MINSESQKHHIRELLLGRLDEEQSSALEGDLLSDHGLWELSEIVDSELIESHLAGELPKDEAQRRTKILLASETGQRHVSFLLALRRISKKSHLASRTGGAQAPGRVLSMSRWLNLAPPVARTMAAIFTAAVVGLLVLSGTLLTSDRRAEGTATTIDSSNEFLAPIKGTYILRPISRDSAEHSEISFLAGSEIIEIWLELPGPQRRFDAVITAQGTVLAEIKDAKTKELRWGNVVVLELQQDLFTQPATSLEISLISQEAFQPWHYSVSISK